MDGSANRRNKAAFSHFSIACSRLSVSEDDRKSERATSGIFQSSTDREPGTD